MRLTRRISCLSMIAALLWCASTLAWAQKSKDASPPAGKPITAVGCLTGYEGRYTLGTSSDMLYLLEGDTDAFKRLNARMVEATGTVSEPPPHTSKDDVLSQQPPTLTVTKLKKVADGCGN